MTVTPGGFMPLRGWETPPRTITVGEDVEAVLPSERPGDAETIAALLKTEPTIEPFRHVPWHIGFALAGLVEPDWIGLRRGKHMAWQGICDRDARSLALLEPMGLPVGTRSILIAYGASDARDRLARLLDRLAGVRLDTLRIRVEPLAHPASPGQAVLQTTHHRLVLNWA